MAQATEAVGIVLKEVRVHRADAQAELSGVLLHCLPIIFPVPGYVDGDARADAGDLLHLGRVCQLLAQGASSPRPVKHLEARPRIAIAPRGRFNGELLDFLYNSVDI